MPTVIDHGYGGTIEVFTPGEPEFATEAYTVLVAPPIGSHEPRYVFTLNDEQRDALVRALSADGATEQ